ncbi:hypothetical protein pqer_cds_685 [Pandoravirus quercus]|uniref:Uncharacterized protein n=1 Tax=Pandoravirus quercus TaxID=2107709 RepID=A0A2U7U9I4_9VIRU|nr:hypothetical protein pqer_cds_685 [Pandoravirus quercus]AVK75107.1 hypothetical protein pqer_cds_685 [Pandoravirus quercus]
MAARPNSTPCATPSSHHIPLQATNGCALGGTTRTTAPCCGDNWHRSATSASFTATAYARHQMAPCTRASGTWGNPTAWAGALCPMGALSRATGRGTCPMTFAPGRTCNSLKSHVYALICARACT